ncbi:ABC transporter ATP-binding protein [Corynebacterium mendelii]|uniref:ABC transporter ATP-binding protein n=1 Tax=Corynebacterium mendelii TaxID=2765362 RepID=A0A939E0Z7_9CORY|nr:ABC transporter ATP-binding protein [Corynebacterium mendelii]MBN9643487.1 ABC transporter ATP-binding protein [Corynebacterium mendelii]
MSGRTATDTTAQPDAGDALQPAPVGTIVRTLGRMPSKPSASWWILTIGIFSITMGAQTAGNSLWGRMVDVATGQAVGIFGKGHSAVVTLAATIAVLMVLETLGRTMGSWFLLSRSARLGVDLRKACLGSALNAPVPDVLELGTGNVISRLTRDIDDTLSLIRDAGTRLIITVLAFPFTFFALIMVSWHFAVLFVVLVAVAWPAVKVSLLILPGLSNNASTAEARRNNMLLDTVRGMPTIRALGLGDWAKKRLENNSWKAVTARTKVSAALNQVLTQAFLLYTVLLVLTLGIAMLAITAGTITLGQATAAVLLVARLEVHVFNILMFAGSIQRGLTSLGRAVSLANLADTSRAGQVLPADCAPGVPVDCNRLTVAYNSAPPVIDNLSLTLEGGTTTALVGASGAGKSTLAAAIAGLVRPASGTITVGGTDTATVPDTWTTRQVLLMSQEVHLFSGTLRGDLSMAKPGAEDSELLAALAAVGLDEKTDSWNRFFPAGLDTNIGAGHDDIEPVVAQQIAMARTLLVDPPVLIMDEATSEAGSDHARALEKAAAMLSEGRTSLVVAHRLDQAETADRILLMDNGRIIEDGTHEELIAAGGRYAQLYQRWSAT